MTERCRYLAVVLGLAQRGYAIIHGRVHYVEAGSGTAKNLDGIVRDAAGNLYLVDYTWTAQQGALNANDLKGKREDCDKRFSAMPFATFDGGENYYNQFGGILVVHLQYTGELTLDLRTRPDI